MVARDSLRNRALRRSCPSKHCALRAYKTLAGSGIDDSIILLTPPWGSAVEGGVNHGGPGFGMKSLSCTRNPCKSTPGIQDAACQLLADAEIIDSITLPAPPWGSVVEGGVDHGGPRFALKSRSHSRSLCKSAPRYGLPTTRRRFIR